MIERAVEKANAQNAELLLHAGDFISPFTASKFKNFKAKKIGVFGNNDGDKNLLLKKYSEIGFEIRGKFAEINVDNLRIALLHGDETELLNSLINCGGYDIVIHGHTHEAKVYKVNKTLVLNPGETCGYLTGKATAALLNTKTMRVEIIEL